MISRRDTIFLMGVLALGLSATSSAWAADPPFPQPEDWTDPLFTQPFVDVDEWRGTPVRHRYVHGGFKGTDTLFSFYFPPKDHYQGRFFQPIAAVSGNENSAQSATGPNTPIGFAVASGGYLVQSNLGKKDMFPSADSAMNQIVGYRASAAVAKYSRVVAAEMYGPHRAYGYVYGGSGGAFKTISCVQNTTGIWDGSMPYVMGSPMAMPSMFTVVGHALRVLKGKFPAILDAIDPGGSGDMYAGLNEEQRGALLEATRFGFPPRTWFIYYRMGMGALPSLMESVIALDPTYFDDFWKVPGYLGANPTESLKAARVQQRTTIKKVVMADEARKLGLPLPLAASAAGAAGMVPAAFQVETLPQGDLVGASLIVKSGEALYITAVIGDSITVGFGSSAGHVVNEIKAGDEVLIDNSTWLAFQTYHRHQVPSSDYYAWDQFRGPNGKPLYPQRPQILGPLLASMNGSIQNGRFAGKMIAVQSLMDEAAIPWNADWYRSKVKEALGAHVGDNFRLWYTDHAFHGGAGPGPATGKDLVRVINDTGVLQQALRDLSAWVEKGTPPPANTDYKVVDAQIVVPPRAAARKGIQPVVTLTANGGARADVAVGAPVNFSGIVEVPPNTGAVVSAEWDFEGAGDYPVKGQFEDTRSSHVTLKTTYSFSKPGTYFPALRVDSQRQGDATSLYARVTNLGRVRVVVT